MTDSEDDEICKAIVISEADSDIRETVFLCAVLKNKCAILEMHTKEPSLEETFIRLTGNGSRQMAERNSRRRKRRENKMRAIYKRELKSYFTSAIAWVFLAFFLVLTGLFFLPV